MSRIASNKPLVTVSRQELEVAAREADWHLVGKLARPDGEVQTIWDATGRYVGTVKVMDGPETYLTP